ncbi:MAG: carbohydrate binding family 9 domain-containing protein [Bacteroidetes bacterium]|nr:carbohydrate binding family 9 domain-containing protein [Bacteroidota bacterium]
MKHLFLLFFLLIFIPVFSQIGYKIQANLVAKNNIQIDGLISELSWKNADSIHQFWQNFPYDTSIAETKTTVKVLTDDKFLYIAANCYDGLKGNYIVTSLKRDFSYPKSDAFSVHIDPFNDNANGFAFTVSPFGVQREGLIQNGGNQGVTTDWDNKWLTETKLHSWGYTVEMAIPFKSLRYNNGDSIWHINFSRNDLKRNENSTWKPVPRNMNIASLVNTGILKWQTPPPKQGFNAAIIPYIIASINQPNSQKDEFSQKYNAGLDAKIVLTPSLNLDITTNPDFAQVEVDRQVINLTRFSIFFPERRNFFIENSDLFASFGFRQIRPFFSRQIGLKKGINIPIYYGVRLSGKFDANWRIGAMNIQTNDSNNYSVAAFQRKIFSSSNIAGILVNKVQLFNPEKFNRVAGLDYNLQSKNGKWLGKAFWHQSFSEVKNNNSFANATWLYFTDKTMYFMWNHEYVDKTFNATTGFVPRTSYYDMKTGKTLMLSYFRIEPEAGYKFFPKSKLINNINPEVYSDIYKNSDWSKNDILVTPSVAINFQNSAIASVLYNIHQTNLLFDTDVLGNGKDTFYKGIYNYRYFSAFFQSNKRKLFSYYLNSTIGEFYNGKRQNFKADLSYRIQPYFIFGLSSSLDLIQINYATKKLDRSLILIAPSVEISFTKKLFFTTFAQYNSQLDNININTRLQYRFKPMSDFYLVYSDNYFTTWKAKNRGITLKLVYWLNT